MIKRSLKKESEIEKDEKKDKNTENNNIYKAKRNEIQKKN